MSEPFDGNVYKINLSHVKSAAEIVYDLTTLLDSEDARNKKICLKLGDIDLNQSQILSIKSLINSINSTLSFMDTNSNVTANAALGLGIILSNADKAETLSEPAPEMTYKKIDEVISSFEEQELQKTESCVPEEYKEVSEFQVTEEIEIPSSPREYEKLDDHQDEAEVYEDVEYNEACEPQEFYESHEQSEYSEPTEPAELAEDAEQDNQEVVEENCLEQIKLDIPASEEIQEELDVIFDAEKKLENILYSENEETETSSRPLYTEIIEEAKEYTEEDFELDSFSTKYMKQTIRSGQVINFEGNIVIIGDCHPGSEISASGDITIWGVLSGIAHAGSNGNTRAKVRALNMNAIQLRIADCYARRPDALSTIFVEKTNSFVPEEARIINDEIVIFKIND